jgi:hypothetical protein
MIASADTGEDGVVHLRKVGVVRDLGRQVLVNSGVKRGDQGFSQRGHGCRRKWISS